MLLSLKQFENCCLRLLQLRNFAQVRLHFVTDSFDKTRLVKKYYAALKAVWNFQVKHSGFKCDGLNLIKGSALFQNCILKSLNFLRFDKCLFNLWDYLQNPEVLEALLWLEIIAFPRADAPAHIAMYRCILSNSHLQSENKNR